MNKDPKLDPNKDIEDAIEQLQASPSDELLAHILTLIRYRSLEGGHFIIGVESREDSVTNSLSLATLTTSDGKKWFYAYTSYDEQFKSSSKVYSGFTSEISQIFDMALNAEDVSGLILNPYGKVLMLNKQLIQIIKGAV